MDWERMMKRKRNKRSGYSLLEMLGYIAVLGIGINLCGGLLITGSRVNTLMTETLDRMEGIAEIESAFRASAGRASEVVDGTGAFKTSENTLVLRVPGADGAARYIVLGPVLDPDRLSRIELVEKNGALENVWTKTYRQPVAYLRFDIEKGGARPLLHLATKVKRKAGEPDRNHLEHHFTAVSGARHAAGKGASS
jgi:type II secretory pathway pseudopilin PulG